MKFVVGIGNKLDADLAGKFLQEAAPGTQVVAVAVIQPPKLLARIAPPRSKISQATRDLAALERTHAADLLASFADNLSQRGIQVQTDVVLGDPAKKLIDAAKGHRADFILTAKRHSSAAQPHLLGHVAARVARYAPCSVVLLSPSRPPPKVYLLATDGSQQAQRAGERLRCLPLTGSPSLLICTVVPPFNPSFIKSGGVDFKSYQRLLDGIWEQEKATAQTILDQSMAEFKDTGFHATMMAYEGDAVTTLLKVIKDANVDLLALGAKGMSSAEFLLGGITLKMLNATPCSLLIAR